MPDFDVNRFLNKFGMNNFNQRSMIPNNNIPNIKAGTPKPIPVQQQAVSNQSVVPSPIIQPAPVIQKNLQIQSLDKAIYARDLFQMPRNLNEFIYMMQKGLTQAQFNQMFANQFLQRNSLSQMQAQILAQLQSGNVVQNAQILDSQLKNLKNLEILSNGLINLKDISQMIQVNGKEAITKLIMTMTEASKVGINDLSQLKEMAKLINASVAVAAENQPQKTMKLLVMLYLPWLPLNEGVGFDLEIGTTGEDEKETDNILVITITTRNYGIVRATLILDTSNSINTVIECSKDFPKKVLEEKIKEENKKYSMETLTSFVVGKNNSIKNNQAHVMMNTSNTAKVNPYLLLMAQCIIKNVIEIDNNTNN